MSALDRPRSSAWSIGWRWRLIVRLSSTKAGIRQRRNYTAMRLLFGHGASEVVHLSRDRALDTVRQKDLVPNEGYVWDVSGSDEVAFTGWEWSHVRGLLRTANCMLVVIVDNARQVPAELPSVVTLEAPDAVEVAVAALRQRSGRIDEAGRVVENKLADLLGPGTPPAKAVWAATLAAEHPPEEARTNLIKGLEHAVADRYENLSAISYAMLMAVAVLENQPYDEVARLATVLDMLIRTAELPEDKKLRPRRVFDSSRDELLAAVGAQVVLRDHPEHKGLREETVRFVRPGWADAVLCRIWVQYHMLHPIVLDWMGQPETFKRFRGECALALSRLITTVPAHAPLEITNQLALAASTTKRYLAASTLGHIAGQAGHRDLVESQLQKWIANGKARQRWTAARLYGTRYSKGNTAQALTQLERIVRTGQRSLLVCQGVAVTMIDLVERTEDRELVLRRVLAWCRVYDRAGGADSLREIGHTVALFVSGMVTDLYGGPSDPVLLAQEYPDIVRQLATLVLRNQQLADIAIDRLYELCRQIDLDALTPSRKATSRRKEIVRLVGLLTPDFRWFTRRRTVAALARRHPGRTKAIRYIFRTANRARKQLLAKTTSPRPAGNPEHRSLLEAGDPVVAGGGVPVDAVGFAGEAGKQWSKDQRA
jgi:hypothetical protein